jgi:hypothetical protein
MLATALFAGTMPAAQSQDVNVPVPVADLERAITNDPFKIVGAEISRPKAKGDITLKAQVSFADQPPITVKLRKAEPGADTYNNVPRYDLAAYELQKLFLDPAEFVVPPTALRFVPIADWKQYQDDVERTFRNAEQVLGVMQYWLQDVKATADVFYPDRFESDAVYARHVGQLNILTDLIDHQDSNAGNFLISRVPEGARVFSIDNGVAFASEESDRGKLWRDLRIKKLPADAVERLRKITEQTLTDSLGVLAQWELKGDAYVSVAKGENLSSGQGVRQKDGVLQMGLKKSEISKILRNVESLLKQVDSGKVTTF